MKCRYLIAVSAGLLLGWMIAEAANAAQVSPSPATQIDHSGTMTGSAIAGLALNSCGGTNGCRVDCFFQNKGVNVMFYSFTGTANAFSKQLQPGDRMYCLNGVTVDQGALSILGTTGDAYSLTESFQAAP